MESYKRALAGEYRLWTMDSRVEGRAMAETSLVDLRDALHRGNRSIISDELANDIAARLSKREQIMLFINKRGYNSFVSCRSCGEAVKCPHCDVSMALHSGNNTQKGVLVCHYCGETVARPEVCPVCGSKYIRFFGTGTQKVEEEV